ncbi:hypothetical protein [Streptomyces sp. NPDC048473]|uniref:hypothetical protein n=1 Tax=unclassified Streptomyces TaxID=2593676 RepID=UPI00371EB622
MDAQVANALLSSGNAGEGRMSVPYDKAIGFYDDARHTVSGLLPAADGALTVLGLRPRLAEFRV